MNRIVKVVLTLADGDWYVDVTKEFAPEHGGGSQVFREYAGPEIHRAIDVARSMVTLSPGQRTDLVGCSICGRLPDAHDDDECRREYELGSSDDTQGAKGESRCN